MSQVFVLTSFDQDDTIPTTLELDMYYDKPNETCFVTRDGHLDTKAGADFISKTLVGLLGYKIHTYRGSHILTGNGLLTPIGQISPYFQGQKRSKTMKRKFLVVRNLPVDIILGIGFINEFKVYSIGPFLLVMGLSPLKEGQSLCTFTTNLPKSNFD